VGGVKTHRFLNVVKISLTYFVRERNEKGVNEKGGQ
jgi:hypothetical protein